MWKHLIAQACLVAAASTFALASCSGVPGTRRGELHVVEGKPAAEINGSLRVLSFNVAHGRRESFHQMFVTKGTIRANLQRISAMLERERPDIVALQEADGPSFWSGAFNHVEEVARGSGMPVAVHGAHVNGPGLHYGTGLLSRAEVVDPVALTFQPSPPTPPKGLTVGSVKLDGVLVDVVSIHLDFAASDARKAQVNEMVSLLKNRGRPMIVMGDFNSQWEDDESAVRAAVNELGLVAYQPENHDAALNTFPTFKARIDWILFSPQLEVTSYRVLADALSDHRPVTAEIRFKQQSQLAAAQ
jgi:endonuclease/exonuclease/phosphatase family metal-dependent hydrolase